MKKNLTMRGSRWVVYGGLLGMASVGAAQARPDAVRQPFAIPAQALPSALNTLAQQIHVSLLIAQGCRQGQSRAVQGTLTASEALNRLLAGSGCTYRYSGPGTVVISSTPKTKPGATGHSAASESAGSDTTTMPTVLVTAHITGLAATRMATSLREIPQSVSILDQERIRTQNLADLKDALNQATGVSVSQMDTLNSNFYARGFVIDSYHLDGGAPIQMYTLDATMPDLSEYDRVEVLRGADGLFGGAGNPSATLDLVRKRPQADPAVTVDQLVGSWDTFRSELDATGPLAQGGRLRGRVVGTVDNRDYFYDTAFTHLKKLYGILEYDLTPSTLLTVGGSVERRHARPNLEGAPSYADGGDVHLPRSLYLGLPWSRTSTKTTEAFAQLEHHFNKDWTFKVDGTRTVDTADDLVGWPQGPIERGTGRLLGGVQEASDKIATTQLVGNAQLTGAFDWGGRRQEILLGADYQHFQTNEGGDGFDTSLGLPLTAFAFDPSGYPRPIGVPNSSDSAFNRISQYGLYGSFKLRAFVDGLSFTGGVRSSGYRESAETQSQQLGVVVNSATTSYSTHGVLTPSVGVTYDLSKHTSVYASYAEIYAPPNLGLDSASGQVLDQPETGSNLEVGLKGAWNHDLFNGSLALFRVRQDGEAFLGPIVKLTDPNCCYVLGSTRSKGVEAEFNGQLTPNWQLGVGYTFDINHTSILDASGGQTELPKHLFKLWTEYQLPGDRRRWTIGGDLHAQSKNFMRDTACPTLIDPVSGECPVAQVPYHPIQGFFAVVGLRVGYRLNDSWELAVNLNNIFDRTYYQTLGYANNGNWYGEPRNIMLSIHGSL